jgi:hypothetical protein
MIGAVLEAEGLHTFYAKSHILHRVGSNDAARRDRPIVGDEMGPVR